MVKKRRDSFYSRNIDRIINIPAKVVLTKRLKRKGVPGRERVYVDRG